MVIFEHTGIVVSAESREQKKRKIEHRTILDIQNDNHFILLINDRTTKRFDNESKTPK